MKKKYKVYLWIFFLALISSFIGSAITHSLVSRDKHSYFEKGMKMGSYITACKLRREQQVYVSMNETLYVRSCLKSEGNSTLRLGNKVFNRLNITEELNLYFKYLDSNRVSEELDKVYYQYIPMGELFGPN